MNAIIVEPVIVWAGGSAVRTGYRARSGKRSEVGQTRMEVIKKIMK